MPTLDIALLHHPCAVPAEMAAVIVGPQGPPGEGIDIAALPLAADASAPDGFVVRQAGVWCVASYAQMQSWLGAAPAPATGSPVTVNGTPLTVNGEPLTTGI